MQRLCLILSNLMCNLGLTSSLFQWSYTGGHLLLLFSTWASNCFWMLGKFSVLPVLVKDTPTGTDSITHSWQPWRAPCKSPRKGDPSAEREVQLVCLQLLQPWIFMAFTLRPRESYLQQGPDHRGTTAWLSTQWGVLQRSTLGPTALHQPSGESLRVTLMWRLLLPKSVSTLFAFHSGHTSLCSHLPSLPFILHRGFPQ